MKEVYTVRARTILDPTALHRASDCETDTMTLLGELVFDEASSWEICRDLRCDETKW